MTDVETIKRARTFLFVPGDRPDRFQSALNSEADCVVIDLEDAVAPSAKPAAREHLAALLRGAESAKPVGVRVNDLHTSEGEIDLKLLAEICRHGQETVEIAVMVPKADSVETLAQLAAQLPGTALLPLVETAAGVLQTPMLAKAPGVVRLVFGHLDLAADLSFDPDDSARLAPARFALVLASAAAGLPSPVDGISDEVRNLNTVEAAARESLASGFTGKLCIHPAQVPAIHRALAPTEVDLAWAESVIAAIQDDGVAMVGSRMVDRPVLLRAHAILARAGSPNKTSGSATGVS